MIGFEDSDTSKIILKIKIAHRALIVNRPLFRLSNIQLKDHIPKHT